ncbi:MAG: inner membrane CreD family protein [Deltaproteobacteria bacterium]|nr:inner membrane CreD family protein [Deltaproteobacteria bacterium]
MTTLRLIAIGFIFFCTAIAWMVLGSTVTARSGEADGSLRAEVEQLWGGEHLQRAPVAAMVTHDVERAIPHYKDGKQVGTHNELVRRERERRPIALTQSEVRAALDLQHRRKGLLWFPTYGVGFEGHYRFVNDSAERGDAEIAFAFPSAQGVYDGFMFRVDGKEAPPVTDLSRGALLRVELAPGQHVDVDVAYRSRGIGTWSYWFGDGVSQVRDFSLTLATNVADIDFPNGSMSPSTRAGNTLTWAFDNLVTGQHIAVELPSRLNPGPVAARISFFAPVSLLFFFTVMVIIGVVKNRSLHPMNYFFLAAAFFAFHLLLAYLVDVVDIFAAFGIAAVVSVGLLVSYLRIVMGQRAAWLQAAAAQLIFLVLFSCAFFVEGQTGLSVAVGATATLFVLMQLTARVKWSEVFSSDAPAPGTSGLPVALPRGDR